MATVLPVSFGLNAPKLPKKNLASSHNANYSLASKSASEWTEETAVPNPKAGLATLLAVTTLCAIAIASLIRAGR